MSKNFFFYLSTASKTWILFSSIKFPRKLFLFLVVVCMNTNVYTKREERVHLSSVGRKPARRLTVPYLNNFFIFFLKEPHRYLWQSPAFSYSYSKWYHWNSSECEATNSVSFYERSEATKGMYHLLKPLGMATCRKGVQKYHQGVFIDLCNQKSYLQDGHKNAREEHKTRINLYYFLLSMLQIYIYFFYFLSFSANYFTASLFSYLYLFQSFF